MSESGDSPIVRFGMVMFAVILLIASPFGALKAYRSYAEAKASTSWPSVQGKVTKAELLRVDEWKSSMYRAEIEYTYEVAGRQRRGTRITADDSRLTTKSATEQLLVQYPLGSVPIVYYDRENPENAVLQPGATSGILVLVVTSLFMFSLGGFILWLWIAGLRSRQHSTHL